MDTILLFFSDLTGSVYNSNRSNKKEVSNFETMMVSFMEFHKRNFKFSIPRTKGGKIWFHFRMDVFIEDEKGVMTPAARPEELDARPIH